MLQLETALDGSRTLAARQSYGKLYVHSALSPKTEAEAWAGKLGKCEGLVVIYGLGLGYHVAATLRQCRDDAMVVVVDPDVQVQSLAREASPEIFKDARVKFASGWPDFKSQYSGHLARYKGAKFAALGSYKQLYPTEYKEFCSRWLRELQSLHSDVITSIRFSYDWQKNIIKNLRYVKDSFPVSRLFGKWQGKPLILVSAGPSLARDMEILRKAKGRAIIMAVGGTAPFHVEHKFEPDFMIAFDGGFDNFWAHFKGLNCTTPLIYDLILHHKVLEEYPGPKVLMSVWPGDAWINIHVGMDVGYVQIGPSVANSALDLALKMGANPILFVGQDLAYIGGQTHSAGVNPLMKDQPANLRAWDTVWLDGIQGNPVPANRSLVAFLHCLEERIGQEKGRALINTSCNGAKIRGTIDLNLAAALERFCSADLSSEIKQIKADLFTPIPYDLQRLRGAVRAARLAGERLLQQIEAGSDLKAEIGNPQYTFFYFALQPVWNALQSGTADAWCRGEAKKAVHFVLPLLDETYQEMTC